jgi:hypothetical protein
MKDLCRCIVQRIDTSLRFVRRAPRITHALSSRKQDYCDYLDRYGRSLVRGLLITDTGAQYLALTHEVKDVERIRPINRSQYAIDCCFDDLVPPRCVGRQRLTWTHSNGCRCHPLPERRYATQTISNNLSIHAITLSSHCVPFCRYLMCIVP